jgi:exonuclease III
MTLHTLAIGTLNINGISNATKTKMLDNFLQTYAIDFLCLQKVKSSAIDQFRNYVVCLNIGNEGRGTAITHKDIYSFIDVEKLSTGRGIKGTFHGLTIVNIYAPSGSNKRGEREEFYNTEVPRLITRPGNNIILAGYFNCVLNPSDTTGTLNTSRALQTLIHGIDLHDIWDRKNTSPAYTHYHANGAARLDRIYMTRSSMGNIKKSVIYATAFTDHLAVLLYIELSPTNALRSRGYWKIKNALLCDAGVEDKFKRNWAEWKRRANKYPSLTHWWVCAVKRKVGKLLQWLGAERKRDQNLMENFYYY